MAKQSKIDVSVAPPQFANIVSDPHVFGGRHRVKGTNVTVDRLVLMTSQGFSKARIRNLLDGISDSCIDEALAFHAAGLNPPAEIVPQELAVHTQARLETADKRIVNAQAKEAELQAALASEEKPREDVFARERQRAKDRLAELALQNAARKVDPAAFKPLEVIVAGPVAKSTADLASATADAAGVHGATGSVPVDDLFSPEIAAIVATAPVEGG